jgi:hypothetical protein
VPNLKVTPEYISNLKLHLQNAKEKLDAAFGAPTSSDGGYPTKLTDSHGATAGAGSDAIMSALESHRGEVHNHLTTCIDRCQNLLIAAQQTYLGADAEQGDILRNQMNTGG